MRTSDNGNKYIESYKSRVIARIKIAGIIICWCWIIYAVGVILRTTVYTVPIGDDFDYALRIRRYVEESGFLSGRLRFVGDIYTQWQGCWFSMTAHAFLNPLLLEGFPQLRITMLTINLLFFVLFFLLVRRLVISFGCSEAIIWTGIYALFVYTIAALGHFQETFFWFTGAAGYTIPLLMLVILWIAVLHISDDGLHLRRWTGIAVVAGFSACGGVLSNAAVGCLITLIAVIAYWVRNKQFNYRLLIVFLICFAGTLLNTLAPGNFLRMNAEAGNASLYATWGNMLYVVRDNLEWLLRRTSFPTVVVLLFLIGFLLSRQANLHMTSYAVTTTLILSAPFLVVFPVVYGYGAHWMPVRCVFLLTVVEFFCYGNVAVFLGCCLGKRLRIRAGRIGVCVACGAAAIWIMIGSRFTPDAYAYRRLAPKIREGGAVREHYYVVRNLLEGLREQPGTDVIADVPEEENAIDDYYCFALSDNPEDNTTVAGFYGLHSIARGVPDTAK